ncbi:MAG TPA: MMPL family transporter [Verrucomicrobiae bacterium]
MRPCRHWLWLLLLLPLGLGVARLRFDVDILNLLPANLSVAQGLKLYQKHFANSGELIITLQAPSAAEAEAAARSLANLLRRQTNLVAGVTWQPAWMDEPAQAMELVAYLWLNQPPGVFAELTGRLASTNLTRTLNETRERLTTSLSPTDIALGGYDPYGLTRLPESVSAVAQDMGTGDELFTSQDGTFRLVFVAGKPDLSGYKACRTWLAQLQHIIAEGQRSGQVPSTAELHYTGRPAFAVEISRSMENDMGGTSVGTLAVIGLLFWLTHRRFLPLVWLLLLLVAILAGALALGGLFIGTINIVSLGFASILLGLAEDFGIVIYEESRSHPSWSGRELRREAAPGIWWSAVTTAGAFLMLNLSALPGLAQLGSLVAIGIFLAAFVMLFGYTPLVLRFRRTADRQPHPAVKRERLLLFQTSRLLPSPVIWTISALLLVVAAGLLWKDGIRTDNSPDPLKPKNSEAYAALDKIKASLTRSEEPLWVLMPGRDEAEVGQRLAQVTVSLREAASNHLIAGFTLPTVLWPRPDNQRANRPVVAVLAQEREALHRAAQDAGFTSDAFFVTENVLDAWKAAATTTNVFWPTNAASRWLLARFVARPDSGFLAMGLIQPTNNAAATKQFVAAWPPEFERQGVILSGWNLLGWAVFDLVLRELPRVVIAVFLLVILSLWLAFRNLKDVILSLGTLAFSAVCLAALTDLLHWDWNLLNVMGLPLLLGMGVDFSIHIQLALRRHAGDLLAVRRSVGRALLLAGSTTVAGFGALAFSSNAGMASLGKTCALGIVLSLLVAVYLLPVWWQACHGRTPVQQLLPPVRPDKKAG